MALYTYGLENSDAEILWDLFDDNRKNLELVAFSNHLNNIDYNLSKLFSKIDSIEKNLI